jgi:carbon-monoxide dehydrogenase large subunit
MSAADRSDPPTAAASQCAGPPGPPATAGDDARRLLVGRGRYVDDRPATDGTLYAAFARSPLARARIDALDLDAARQTPGVVALFRGADVAHLPTLAVNPVGGEVRSFARPLLAVDEARCVGDPVALVIARSALAARDAAESVILDGDPLLPVLDPVFALDAPPLVAGWPDNLVYQRRWRTPGVTAAFAGAARVVRVALAFPRVAPTALEPRAVQAAWDERTQRLELWLGTQSPHRARDEIARVLGLDPSAVRVVAPDVGGAFGARASPYPEDVLLAWAARTLRATVRWTEPRIESFASVSHGRGARVRASLALDARGAPLALRADWVVPVGAWATFSAAVPGWNAGRIAGGPYAIDEVDIRVRGVALHTAAVGIYRGAGRPEAATLLERLADAAAADLGDEPLALRRRWARRPAALPHALPTGAVLDTGDYPALLERLAAVADYPAARARQALRRAAGELVGLGLALYVEPCGQGWESATVRRDADGAFTVASGSASQGQGHRVAWATIAAEALGVDPARITVLEGDTATAPAGIGALASRSIAIGGSAVAEAARRLRGRIDAAAAGAVASAAAPRTPGVDGGRADAMHETVVYHAPREAWASGAALAEVAIDRDTGALRVERFVWVDDAGRVIDPAGADGQLLGGLAQGLGSVLMEQVRYDESGQLLTGTLMDYALPRADDMPDRVTLHAAPTATDANLLGARGVGESGCIVAPPALLNAALDALAPLGVTELALPLTAETLWRAIHRLAPLDPPPPLPDPDD